MRADIDIERDVKAELKWSPDVNETDIAINVTGSVVALTGYVVNSTEKYRAEAAVKRIAGVSAVANELLVRPPLGSPPSDPQIARDAVAALRAEVPLIWQNITLLVKEGHVGLEGTVEWHYERERAEAAVHRVAGVLSVRNSIKLVPRVAPADIKHKIQEAFRRSAMIDAQKVHVDARDGEITLRGEVRSWAEHDQAQQTAWAAPGVLSVKNELAVRT